MMGVSMRANVFRAALALAVAALSQYTFGQHAQLQTVDPTSLTPMQSWLTDGAGKALAVGFSPDGSRLAVGKGDVLSVIDPKTGQMKWVQAGGDIVPRSIASMPGGRPMLIVANDPWTSGKVTFFHWDSPDSLGALNPYGGGRNGLATYFAPGGIAADVIFAMPQGKVVIFDLKTNSVKRSEGWQTEPNKVNAVAVGPFGRKFTGGSSGAVTEFFNDGRTETVIKFDSPVLAVAANPYIKGVKGGEILLAAGDNRGNVKVRDHNTQKLLFDANMGKETKVLRFHPTDPRLLIVGMHSAIKIIDVKAGKVVAEFPFKPEVWSMDISADGQHVAVGGGDQRVYLYQFGGNKDAATTPTAKNQSSTIPTVLLFDLYDAKSSMRAEAKSQLNAHMKSEALKLPCISTASDQERDAMAKNAGFVAMNWASSPSVAKRTYSDFSVNGYLVTSLTDDPKNANGARLSVITEGANVPSGYWVASAPKPDIDQIKAAITRLLLEVCKK